MAKIRGWKFPIEVNETTGKIMTVEDDENIKQSIKIILQTEKYERIKLPYFGTSLDQYVFQSVTPILMTDMRSEINDSIRRWEKNLDDLDVDIRRLDDGDNSSVLAEISYVSPVTGRVEQVIKEANLVEGQKIEL